MGQKPDDIASEIDQLREETDVIVDELLRRASLPAVARGLTDTVTDAAEAAAGEATTEVPRFVRRNPVTLAGALLGVLASVGMFALSTGVLPRRRAPRRYSPSVLSLAALSLLAGLGMVVASGSLQEQRGGEAEAGVGDVP